MKRRITRSIGTLHPVNRQRLERCSKIKCYWCQYSLPSCDLDRSEWCREGSFSYTWWFYARRAYSYAFTFLGVLFCISCTSILFYFIRRSFLTPIVVSIFGRTKMAKGFLNGLKESISIFELSLSLYVWSCMQICSVSVCCLSHRRFSLILKNLIYLRFPSRIYEIAINILGHFSEFIQIYFIKNQIKKNSD
jgi:hypothetical protein